MTRTRSLRQLNSGHSLLRGAFVLLLALVLAVSPLSMLVRSLGILFLGYTALAFSGLPLALACVLIAPLAGLLAAGNSWLIMLPIMLVSGLLALLGLDFAWRLPALFVSPLLTVLSQVLVLQLSQRSLFAVALPWEPNPQLWIILHGVTALVGTAMVIYLSGRDARQVARHVATSRNV